MIYILKGWIRFVYHLEKDGKTRVEEHLFGPGDCCLQPPAILQATRAWNALKTWNWSLPAHYYANPGCVPG